MYGTEYKNYIICKGTESGVPLLVNLGLGWQQRTVHRGIDTPLCGCSFIILAHSLLYNLLVCIENEVTSGSGPGISGHYQDIAPVNITCSVIFYGR